MENSVLTNIIKELKTQPISFAGSIASLVALGNTILATPSLVQGTFYIPSVELNLILIVCIFLILEGALATVFSKLYFLTREMGEGFPLILTMINGLISAWVTGFNCIALFSNSGPSHSKLEIFIFSLFVGWLISVYFLWYHYKVAKHNRTKYAGAPKDQLEKQYKSHFIVSFIINGISFLFVMFYLGSSV